MSGWKSGSTCAGLVIVHIMRVTRTNTSKPSARIGRAMAITKVVKLGGAETWRCEL